MTPKKAGAIGGAAVALVAAAALMTMAPEGGECFRQNVQVPAADYGKADGLVTVVVERVGAADDPLPEGWDAVTKPEPVDCKGVDAKEAALAWVPEAKYGFAAGETFCPPPPYVAGHEPEGCVEALAAGAKVADPKGVAEPVVEIP